MEFRSFCLKSFHLCCLMFLRIFLPRRQSWPSNLVLVMTETTWISFRTLSMCLPLKTLSNFPLWVTAPLSTTSFHNSEDKPPWITSERTSKSWTSSFCKQILNKSDRTWAVSQALVARQFVPLVRVSRIFEHVALRTYSFAELNVPVKKSLQCRRNHRISTSVNLFAPKSIEMSKVRELT